MENIKSNLPSILKYYPDYAAKHQEYLSLLTGIDADNIVAANGSTELITLLCQEAEAPFASPVPTFGRWTALPMEFGKPVHFIQRRSDNNFSLEVDDILTEVRNSKS